LGTYDYIRFMQNAITLIPVAEIPFKNRSRILITRNMTTTAHNHPARAISVDSILAARQRVYQAAVRTPLVRLYYDDAPGEIYLKLESFQPIGSFKLRGAYNAISLLSAQDRAKGVWTVSAGNAAQGVALAARTLGTRCEVLVMDTAPVAKLDAIKRLGKRRAAM